MGHGGNVEEIARLYRINEEKIVDFSANINPLGLCKGVKEEMVNAISKVERYPDITYFNLKKSISSYEGVSEADILLGNGAAEVIYNIARGLKPKKALLIAPTFIEYRDALESVDCEVVDYILSDDFKIDNGFLDEINHSIDIIFICNPNNPTGILTSKDFLIKVVNRAKDLEITLIVDESFLDFVEDKDDYSMIPLVEKYKNLIVVKSLTKFFAFPGIRIGYGITSNKDYISDINSVSVSWAINTIASYSAIKALGESEYIKSSIEYVKKENEFLYNALKGFNDLKVYRGAVNFIFFKCDNPGLKEILLKKGILIRDCNNYKGLSKGYYRVAVRTREENLRLINALKEEV